MKLSRRHAVFGLLASAPVAFSRSEATTVSRAGTAFGTAVCITVTHDSGMRANAAIDAGFAEIRAIGKSFNLFDPTSEISRLNAQGFLESPSSLMRELVGLCQSMWRKTGGAFDPTVQPLWRLWNEKKGAAPSEDEVIRVRRRIGWRHIEHGASSIRFAKPGMALTFNGIAQGYAADRVIAAMRQHNIISALIDTGEIGLTPGDEPRRFAIRDPRNSDVPASIIDLTQGFIATSGDYATSFTPDFRHHHIFDPATGWSPEELSSATVVAATGAEADAFATAMMVLGKSKSIELAQALDMRAVLIKKADLRTAGSVNQG